MRDLLVIDECLVPTGVVSLVPQTVNEAECLVPTGVVSLVPQTVNEDECLVPTGVTGSSDSE